MFFCPNCNNMYNITKDNTIKNMSGGDKETNYSSQIKEILESNDFDSIKQIVAKVNVPLLLKSTEYKKLSTEDKGLLYNKIEDALPVEMKKILKTKVDSKDVTNQVYFSCSNCLYSEKIRPGTKIYSKTSSNSTTNLNENIDIKLYSNVLPVTRKYVCPNKDCKSHKDISQKEALIYRTSGTFQTKYICKSCETYWNI